MKLKKIFLPLLAALLFAGCSAAPEAQTPSGKFDAEVDYLIVGGGAAGASPVRLKPRIKGLKTS